MKSRDSDHHRIIKKASPHGALGILLAVPWALHHIGGVNVVVRSLIRVWQRGSEARPYVLVLDWSSRRPRHRKVDGRHEVTMRLRSPGGSSIRQWVAFFVYLPATLWRLHRLVRRLDIQTVNVHYPGLWALHLVLLRRLFPSAPSVVLSFHGTDLTSSSETLGPESLLWSLMVHASDGVTACSRVLAVGVEKRFRLKNGSVKVIHNGVDIDVMAKALTEEPPATEMCDGRKWLLTIGTFDPNKGHDILLEAFSVLSQDFPELALMLIGRAAGALAETKDLSRRLGIDDRVLFCPNVPHHQIPRYLRAANIFALPSRSEGFPIVLLEAGLAGLPVVATKVGGIPEMITSGVHGLLVPPDDALALADAIRKLLSDVDMAKQMACTLKARVVEEFSWYRAANRYLCVLNHQCSVDL